MLKDAVMTGSAAVLCAVRCRAKATEEKVEVIVHFVNFINMRYVVGFSQHHHSNPCNDHQTLPRPCPKIQSLLKPFGPLAKQQCCGV